MYLKHGKIYWGKKGDCELVFLVVSKSRYQCLATNKSSWTDTVSICDLQDVKEIAIKDLPLFVGYTLVHSYLALLIKGRGGET